jgi:hypothetical protein
MLTFLMALLISQSLNKISGDFPPSSREHFFRLLFAHLKYREGDYNEPESKTEEPVREKDFSKNGYPGMSLFLFARQNIVICAYLRCEDVAWCCQLAI